MDTKPRCNAPACNKSIASMCFDCKCCHKQFCIKHRIPFDHACSNSDQLIMIDRQKLEQQLVSQVFSKAEKQHLVI